MQSNKPWVWHAGVYGILQNLLLLTCCIWHRILSKLAWIAIQMYQQHPYQDSVVKPIPILIWSLFVFFFFKIIKIPPSCIMCAVKPPVPVSHCASRSLQRAFSVSVHRFLPHFFSFFHALPICQFWPLATCTSCKPLVSQFLMIKTAFGFAFGVSFRLGFTHGDSWELPLHIFELLVAFIQSFFFRENKYFQFLTVRQRRTENTRSQYFFLTHRAKLLYIHIYCTRFSCSSFQDRWFIFYKKQNQWIP